MLQTRDDLPGQGDQNDLPSQHDLLSQDDLPADDDFTSQIHLHAQDDLPGLDDLCERSLPGLLVVSSFSENENSDVFFSDDDECVSKNYTMLLVLFSYKAS